jgi:hypothetical protein
MRVTWMVVVMALAAGEAAMAAPAPATTPGTGTCPHSILFIGNSYTYFNNLPEQVAALMAQGAGCHVQVRMVAPGGAQLRKQWTDDHTRAALTEQKWDFVVLQEQSTLDVDYYLDGTPRVVGDALFAPAARLWSKAIRDAGAQPVFYLTWARRATPEDQGALNHAYISAALQAGAPLAPVGIAWQTVRRERPDLDLYWKDGSHPSPAGSYLAACSIYAALLHRDPRGLPRHLTGTPISVEGSPVAVSQAQNDPSAAAVLVDLSASDAAAIQDAAWRAWNQTSKDGGVSADPGPAVGPTVALPAGEPLRDDDLAGVWRGKLYFFAGFGPVDMTLHLEKVAGGWHGRIDIDYLDKDFKPFSDELPDLKVGAREIVFSDSSSLAVSKRKIDFTGVRRGQELTGTATIISPRKDEPPLTLLGHWVLQREPPTGK